jgi:ATP-dependent Lon protease
MSRFDCERYIEGRKQFTTDEWMDVVLRSVGLEPSKLTRRLKLHFLTRLLPLVEPNYNFIELGPPGTGKSYFFSEFSPYATLVSGGQATKATLFHNNARGKVRLVGFWDTVAFDEVAGIKIKDQDAIQIMKDYMANGRFSRGVEVIANASLAFVGNIDESIQQLVNSTDDDLFLPLPPILDPAVMDRFYCYLPGCNLRGSRAIPGYLLLRGQLEMARRDHRTGQGFEQLCPQRAEVGDLYMNLIPYLRTEWRQSLQLSHGTSPTCR